MERRFSVRNNNIGCKEICPVCKETHKASINYTVFDDSTNQPICRECQEVHAPELRKMIDVYLLSLEESATAAYRNEISKMLEGMNFPELAEEGILSKDEAIKTVEKIIELMKDNDLDCADTMLNEFRGLEFSGVITLKEYHIIFDFIKQKSS